MAYTDEKNVLMLISLLKQHNIKKIIVSPGAQNVTFVASVQNDPFFEIYSSVDERSAAYIACGLAAESGEPVALSCTGATASRNYYPGLTEAYYRNLKILAITSTPHTGSVGQYLPQLIDRTLQPKDTVRISVQIPSIHDSDDAWTSNVAINNAILELHRHGGGPVHINLTTASSRNYDVSELPEARVIRRVSTGDSYPKLPNGRIAVFVGAHNRWTNELTEAVDRFCRTNDAVVLCDHTSNYHGKYRVLANIITDQKQYVSPCMKIDLLIHIGEVSGAYMNLKPKSVWRVSEDGEVRDTFRKLHYVFEMKEERFFKDYATTDGNKKEYYTQWRQERKKLEGKIPELPFSNLWVSQQIARRIPKESVVYLGILNSLRSWNFFEATESLTVYANTGGFGIDGGISSLLGASLSNSQRLFFGVTGDLAFFYDMNALGNRHVRNNIRILLVNNGRGTEFRNYSHRAAALGEDADRFVAAAGHYGKQSRELVKHYAQDLGFEYLCAASKNEIRPSFERFLTPELTDRPILLEVFTDSKLESDALKMMHELEASTSGTAKKMAKVLLGDKGVKTLKKLIKG